VLSAASVARSTRAPTTPDAQVPLDDESARWLRALRSTGAERDAAVARLHELLLRAARFEAQRRACALGPRARWSELDDLAHHSAADALVAILDKLDRYRGESRFTTWAYKFALLEASVKMRRRAWQDREIAVEPDSWRALTAAGLRVDQEVELGELLAAVRDAIARDLTPHQRAVLVALTLDGVPIDVLAQRLGTTRGALYKTLHDARRKLRRALAAEGLRPDSLDPFPAP
jgi:RNA polymerase sigma-70 factor, ECF subfamily